MAVPCENPQEYAIDFRRQPRRSRGLEVRKSSAHSPRSRNQQPRASDAHPCTALCARRCRVHRAAWFSNEFHLATCLAPAHAHASATTCAKETSIGNGYAHHCCRLNAHHRPARTTALLVPSAQLNQCCTHNLRAPGASSLAQLSRTLSRNCRNTEPERALNRKQELPHRGCTQRIAIARQSVTTDPSFFA